MILLLSFRIFLGRLLLHLWELQPHHDLFQDCLDLIINASLLLAVSSSSLPCVVASFSSRFLFGLLCWNWLLHLGYCRPLLVTRHVHPLQRDTGSCVLGMTWNAGVRSGCQLNDLVRPAVLAVSVLWQRHVHLQLHLLL